MKVLVVEPMKKPYSKEIDGSLESMQGGIPKANPTIWSAALSFWWGWERRISNPSPRN